MTASLVQFLRGSDEAELAFRTDIKGQVIAGVATVIGFAGISRRSLRRCMRRRACSYVCRGRVCLREGLETLCNL